MSAVLERTEAVVDAQPLHLTLAMDDAQRARLREAEGIVAVAESYIIDTPQMADFVNTELRSIKTRLKIIEEMRRDFLEPAKLLFAKAEKWFDPARLALGSAETILKTKLTGWTQEQERIAAEARRRAEEEARRQRQEAEAKAAAERARAAAAAAEARRKAEEAEAARQKAVAEGNTRAAAAAAAAGAKAEEQARAAIENGEAKAMQAQLEAAAAPSTIAVQELAKIAGFSMRKNWIAELPENTTIEQARESIARAIFGLAHDAPLARPDLLSLLAVDMKTANQLAKALEANFNAPGLLARNAPIAASRGR